MKRLLLIFLLLFCFVWQAEAGTSICGGRPAPGGAAAPGCSTDTAGNIAYEGFEGCAADGASGCHITWTHGAVTPAFNSARPGTQSPTSLCDKSLRVNGATTTQWAQTDINRGTATTYLRFYFYIDSMTLGESDQVFIFAVSESATNPGDCAPFQLELRKSGSDVILRAHGEGSGGSTADTGAVTLDAWHYVDLKLAHSSSAASSAIKLDGGSAITFIMGTGCNIDHIFLGLNYIVDVATDIYFDLFGVDSTDYLGAGS